MPSRYDGQAGRTAPPGPSTIDLHTHTLRSDGVLEPDDLVTAAGTVGVRQLAITDHDSLAGYREARVRIGALAPEMELVPGVEINAVTLAGNGLSDGEIHVLGLGVDPDDEVFEAVLASQRARRRHRFDATIARLRTLGLGVDDQVATLDRTRDDALGRPTVARALIAAGHASSVEDAFDRLLSHGRPGYVPREGIGPAEAIAAIAAADGIAVLAHFSEGPRRLDLVRELMVAGLRGLEVHYRRFSAATIDAMAGVADELGLVRTGGSDFHGDDETYAEAHAQLWVPPAVGERLRDTLAGR